MIAPAVETRVAVAKTTFTAGIYSARSGRKSANCTWSDSYAVRKLAGKLGFKPGLDVVRQGMEADGKTVWHIVQVQP